MEWGWVEWWVEWWSGGGGEASTTIANLLNNTISGPQSNYEVN